VAASNGVPLADIEGKEGGDGRLRCKRSRPSNRKGNDRLSLSSLLDVNANI
jgi:hypothetical protein